MRALFLALGGILLFGLASCSTDVDLNAPYKERPVIYALLDAGQPTQLVRVQKSFLTIQQGSATAAAGTKDSVYYSPSVLSVTLQALNRSTGAPLGSVVNLRDTVGDKDSGLFYYPDQILYKTPAGFKPDPAFLYRLTVVNTKTGTRAEAITGVIPALTQATLISPAVPTQATNLLFYSVNPFVAFRYVARDSVERFNIHIEIRIDEDLEDGTTRSLKPLDWAFAPDQPVQTALVGDNQNNYSVRVDYNNIDNRFRFFDIIKAALYDGSLSDWGPISTQDSLRANRGVLRRRLQPLKLTITRGDLKLSQYLDADRAYSVLTQTRPFYSNVQQGIGLVASRNMAVFYPVNVDNGFVSTCRATPRYKSLLF